MVKLVSFTKTPLLIVVSGVVKLNKFNKQGYNNGEKIINVALVF